MIKEKITKTILNSQFIGRAAITILNSKNYRGGNYKKECDERKRFDLWDCDELCKEMNPYYADLSPNTSYYGIMYQIKKYAGIEGFCYYNVEHGLYLGEYVEKESLGKAIKGTITFSKIRQKYLEKKNVNKIITIGPYIHYAENYYTEGKRRKIKKELGRVLLTFPPHSTKNVQATYNTEIFIKRLRDMSRDYDTTMVCMFYKDILSGAYKPYEKAGFKIVTSGNIYDYNFLSRQKEIIGLSDYTVSASVGTHIGYCLYMGKEHRILSLSNDGSLEDNSHDAFDKYYDGKQPANAKFLSYRNAENLLLNLFSGNIPAEEQRKMVSDLWGFECVKDAEKLHDLLIS